MANSRPDDYKTRRKHLANLTEEELENRFWNLVEQIVDPMIDLAQGNTTPSIERSVLLRMGFSSLEAKAIVDAVLDRNLLGKGAGHVVYKAATVRNLDIRQAGLKLAEGNEELWNEVMTSFKGGVKS